MLPKTETVFKALPFLSGLTIVCGVFKTAAFYSIFNINIMPYLDLSETIFLFFNDFVFVTFLFLFFPSLLYVVDSNDKESTEKRKNPYSIKTMHLIFLGVLLLGSIINILTSRLPKAFVIPTSIIAFLHFYGLLLLIILISSFIKKYEIQYKISVPLFNFLVIGGIVFLFLYALTIGYRDGLRIKYLKWKRIAVVGFLNNNKKVQTSDSLVFVGRTQNYTFFYNPKSDMKTVFPNSEIKEFKTR